MPRPRTQSARIGRGGRGRRVASQPRSNGQSGFRRFMQTRGFVIVLLAIVGALSISVVRETVRRVQIAREVNELSGKIELQQKKNLEMVALTKILNTSAAQEKQSRLTLNTISPGEQVVVLQQKGSTDAIDAEGIVLPTGENLDTVPVRGGTPNPKKWMKYFFNH